MNNIIIEDLRKIRNLLSECDVSLVFEAHLIHTYVNGISSKVTCDKAIVMISDREKKDDIYDDFIKSNYLFNESVIKEFS